MATIHLHQTTSATPEQLVAAITDFGPGRSEIFGRGADSYLQVHERGPTSADVTEGSGGIWERLHYDWSDPGRIVMKTVDSNAWGGDSGHTYTLTRTADGSTSLDAVVVRDGKGLRGRAVEALLAVAGTRVLGKGLERTVRAIEGRQATAGEAVLG